MIIVVSYAGYMPKSGPLSMKQSVNTLECSGGKGFGTAAGIFGLDRAFQNGKLIFILEGLAFAC